MRIVVLFLAYLVSMVMIAAAYGQEAPPIPTPSPAVEDQAFADFVLKYREVALAAGITPENYDAATKGIARNQRVFDHNMNQPEFVKPVWEYLDGAVSARRIRDGRAAFAANEEILNRIWNKYGVPPEIVVSIWGNESHYGRGVGRYNMFEALATLAYDGPRTDYARPQYLAAFKMMQKHGYDPAAMTSSWAGAFGQTQFVPTTFLREAVDGDKDGKIDLWLNVADALASTANVLSNAGWVDGRRWGYEVTLPEGFAYENADIDIAMPVEVWRHRGVKTIGGGELRPNKDLASIYLPAGAKGPAFLVFPNFKVILKYNNAASYALAVCLLADQIKGKPGVVAAWPRELSPLNRNERLTLQASLVQLGYDIGNTDGMIGSKSRAAMRAWQKAHALPADGFATQDLLARIAMEAKTVLAGN